MLQLNSGCGFFVCVAQGLPDESCFGGLLVCFIVQNLLDFEFGWLIVHHLSVVTRFGI